MQIVIEIPDRIQYGIENGITVNGSEASQIALDAIKSGTPLSQGIIATDKAIEIIRKYLGYSDGKPYDTVDAIIEDIMDESEKKGA